MRMVRSSYTSSPQHQESDERKTSPAVTNTMRTTCNENRKPVIVENKTHVLRFEISPTQLSSKHDKNYQKKKWPEIIKAIVGLYNSDGGTLILYYKKSPPNGHLKKCLRMLEQKVKDLLGTITLTFDIDVKIPPSTTQAQSHIKIEVKTATKTRGILAVKNNIYLPSSELIMEISPSENVENIRAILMKIIPQVVPIERDSHCTKFVKDEIVPFSESKTVQFKNFKDDPSTFTTRLASKLKNNKFTCYVSAFANYAGGYIYFGVNDDGKVEGENITEEEMEKIKQKIGTLINKMIWPQNSKPADRWDVYFEPMLDNTKKAIPQKYVVVVFVAQCRGGVFTEEPECYEIIDNKVHKINFSSWVQRMDPRFALEKGTCTANTPSDLVYEELTNHLNKGEELEVIDAAIKTARENYKNDDVDLICLSKFISFYLRRGDYFLVKEYFMEYKKKLDSVSSSSKLHFKVMEQYLRCVMERCKGMYEESYTIAMESLDNLKKLPYCIISAAFYVQIATLENILAMKTDDEKRRLSLRDNAVKNYNLASSHLKQIQGHNTTKAEYLQKIYINTALLHLGCSLTGDVLCDSEDSVNIEKAKNCLRQAHDIILDSHPLSKFRQIQSLFAKACLSYRLGNDEPSRRNETLKHALNYSKEAKNLAEKCTFVEMKEYAENFIKFFQQSEKTI